MDQAQPTGENHIYFPPGKCYKSVVSRCCTLRLSDIPVSETTIVHFLNKLIVSCKEAVRFPF